MFWILVPLAVALLFYYFLLKPQLYWKNKHVKQGAPIPIFGDGLKSLFRQESMVAMSQRIYHRYQDTRYCGMYQTIFPTLMLRDPNLIKQITVKDFDHFVNRQNFTSENIDPLWNRNLIVLEGDRWRKMRATLSPTFTASKMRAMFPLMENSSQQYVDYYMKQNKLVFELELKDSFNRFASDVIANCAFGVSVDSLNEPTNDFYMKAMKLTSLYGIWVNIKVLLNTLVPKIASFFKLGILPPEAVGFFKYLIRNTVKIREEQNINRHDMIDLLMQARLGRLKYDKSGEQKDAGFATAEESYVGTTANANKVEMSELDMAAQVFTFLFAGFESVSTTMSFACYELAINPDIQERLRQEVDEIYVEHKGKLTYDVLNKMAYMDMVVTESLRKHPVVIAVDRMCTKAYTIPPELPDEMPVHLQPGDIIYLPIFAIHHDDKYYPNPNVFDPERFSDERKADIKPYSFIPFGAGPRNCIGSRFALMEMKSLLFHILSKFELTVIDKTRIPIKYVRGQFVPAVEGGCWVGYKRREKPVNA